MEFEGEERSESISKKRCHFQPFKSRSLVGSSLLHQGLKGSMKEACNNHLLVSSIRVVFGVNMYLTSLMAN